MKKIQDVREIINALSLTKDADSVVIPIGMTGDRCHKLVFSCRGRVGNNNGYAVYGNWPEEIRNFLTGLLCNACRRYSPAELALSFYDCRREADGDYDYVRELPNADRVLRIKTAEQLLEETERLRDKYDARLSEIGKYGNCYARAVSAAAKQGASFSMPQELLAFVVPEEVLCEWQSSFSVRSWLDFLMSKVWRVGIYPVVVVCGAGCDFAFRRCFGSEVILFSSRNGFKEASALKPFGALVSIGWDCWDWSDGGREVIDIPEYDDAWIGETKVIP